jgi:hypothetical protein
MASLVDPSVVPDGMDVPKQPFRDMLGIMRDEITALQNRCDAFLEALTECCSVDPGEYPNSSVDDAVLIPLTGPVVTFSDNSVGFGSMPVGETSTTVTLVITNTGIAPLIIDSIEVMGDFELTNIDRSDL